MRHRYLSALSAIPLAAAAFGVALPIATQAQNGAYESRHEDREARDAQKRVNEAVNVVEKAKQDPQFAHLLRDARGVFIIPHFGKGGFIIGGQGGTGVVLAHRHDKWSDPAFFDVGGASIGAQAGGESGSVVMLLMTDRALDHFENSHNKWRLGANAGLTVVKYSGNASAATGRGDVIVWSDARGLYGGLTAGVTDITPSTKLDHAYYQQPATAREILSGNVTNAASDPLRDALMLHVASR